MRYAGFVRTTLEIDDELLLTVKEMAQQRKTTAGSIISSILRDSLRAKPLKREYKNGVPLLPRRPNGPVVTTELVNRLRDEDE
jgi:hypothetical protein